jgi:hypothetical protein
MDGNNQPNGNNQPGNQGQPTPPPRQDAPGQPANVFHFVHQQAPFPYYQPPRGKGYAASAAATVGCLLVIVGLGFYYFRAQEKTVVVEAPAPPPPAPVERIVYRDRPAPPPVEVKKPEPPPPEPVAPPPEPEPPPPPAMWTGIWRSRDRKSSIRLVETPRGVTGFYSVTNAVLAPGDVEGAVVDGDGLSFMAVINDRRFGLRMEREGETAKVVRWIDVDGLREESRKLKALRPRNNLEVAAILRKQQEIQTTMRVAGPEHVKDMGIFTREEAPVQVRTR